MNTANGNVAYLEFRSPGASGTKCGDLEFQFDLEFLEGSSNTNREFVLNNLELLREIGRGDGQWEMLVFQDNGL